MNESLELKNELMSLTGLQWPEGLEETQWMEQLADHIDVLINTNFHQLVQLLYRLDIDEAGLKKVLQQHPGERAGVLIAEKIVERQRQKIESRKAFRQSPPQKDNEEKW
jgi:hypothetical protein